jgi:large subunit ribosomal protein L6
MSRIGKQPIKIPSGVDVKIDDGFLVVKGPLGELRRDFKTSEVAIKKENDEVTVSPKKDNKLSISLWGTYASHIGNMVEGVTKGFEKKLILEGVGFKVNLEGDNLVLNLGFSHPVKVNTPEGIKVTVEKNNMTISGFDKEKVGDFTARVRALKKPEPYKGKGIRYDGEVIRRKAGKKAATV